jgi:hypothetical protein
MNGKFPFSQGRIADDNLLKCVVRTANAVFSTFLAEKSDEIFLIKILDLLLIALKVPFAIRAKSVDAHRVFDTCDLSGMTRSERAVKFPAGVELHILFDESCRHLFDSAFSCLVLIAEAVEWYAGGRATDLGVRMNCAIERLGRDPVIKMPRMPAVVGSAGSLELTDGFFERLEPLTSSAGELCFFPSHTVGANHCSRLFFFHLKTDDDRSLMRLHPLARQRNSLGGKYLRQAENETWSFGDVVSNGPVSWIRLPSEEAECENLTGAGALNAYINVLTKDGDRKADDELERGGHRALAVPLHLGGIPWLVVLFVFTASEDNYGELAYYIYRSVVPPLFDSIAAHAREEYLKLVRDNARTSFSSGKFNVGDLNSRLQRLTRLFPYSEWYLSSEESQFEITAFKETRYLHERSGPLANDLLLVESRTIQREAVCVTLQNAAREAELKFQQERESQQGADEGVGHALKNIVDLTNWTKVLPLVRSSIRNYDRLIADNGQEEIISRLKTVSRSLGLFSLVAGLGHFARLAGAIGRGDYEKFAEWHDADELRRWTSGRSEDVCYICDAYVRTIRCIVASLYSSLSLSSGPQIFELRCSGASRNRRIVKWIDDGESEFSQFDKFTLHIPPFRRGSDAAYSFVFALTEPLVNALRALEELKRDYKFSASDRALRIRISARLPEEVVFSIVNLSRKKVQSTLSGFERTRRMLRRLEIAEIDDLRFQEFRTGTYKAISTVHFRPYDLAMKIAKI